MNQPSDNKNWPDYLKLFNRLNMGRPTRLGKFEQHQDRLIDYWMEDGLPLIGVDVETREGAVEVEVVLDGFVHAVGNTTAIRIHTGPDSHNDGIDIIDSKGDTTILRFEDV